MDWWNLAMSAGAAWAIMAAPWRRGSAALALAWLLAEAVVAQSGDPLPIGLYRCLDLAVIAVLLAGPRSWLDWAVLAGFAAQWWVYWALPFGAEKWWTLFWIALAQMIAAGPWQQVQRAVFSNSHGPLRRAGSVSS